MIDSIMEEVISNFTTTTFFNCTEDNFGPKRDDLYIVIPVTVVYIIIFFTGVIGNISTCIVISRNKSMHTATNFYLFSLAVSDLLQLVSGLPQEVYLIWSRYPYIFGSEFCFLRGLCAETSANATVLTITAFTVERYLAICHPFLSHTMSKLSRAVKFILVIWLVAIVLAIPQAMQFQIVGEGDCEMCLFVKPFIQHSFEVSTLVFFVSPMTLITVLYILIGLRLRSSNLMKKRSTNARVQSKSSRKVIKMLVAVVIAFFICWAPFHGQRLYALYWSQRLQVDDKDTHRYYLNIYEIVTYISGILYYVSATINPILYNIMSVKFREAFKETFTRCCGIGGLQHTRPQRSYSVLSRSAQRGPDSTDSGKEEHTVNTHTTLTQKSSVESFNSTAGGMQAYSRRHKTSTSMQQDGIEEEILPNPDWNDVSSAVIELQTTPTTTYLTINVKTPAATTKLNKFWQFFHCIAKKTLDDSKRFSAYYASPVREPNIIFELERSPNKESLSNNQSCDISNSSLKDVESMALEDELTAYMKEIKRREIYS